MAVKKNSGKFQIVLVTAPNRKVARSIAAVALKERLAVCANIVPGLESHYWWKGKVEKGREMLMLLKTVKARVASLERLIVKHHPYDTPEFVVLSPTAISEKYRVWWEAGLK